MDMRSTAPRVMLALTAVALAGCDGQEPPTGPDLQPYPESPQTAVQALQLGNQWMPAVGQDTPGMASAPSAINGLTFFADLASFQEGCEGLPVEDFEEAPDFRVTFAPPLDANAANNAFAPGDILPGLSITTDNAVPGSDADLVVFPPPYFNFTSKTVFSNYFAESFIMDFTAGNVTRVGGDLIRLFVPNVLSIDIYGASGLLGSTTATGAPSGSFWGVDSEEPITRIEIRDEAWVRVAEGMDNIAFGSCNLPPDVSNAAPSIAALWPPNNKMVEITIEGVTDPDGDPVTITITGITDNEGSGPSDMGGIGTSTAFVRASRNGFGTGRVYTIAFTASDGRGGEADGTVEVVVPHDQGSGEAKGRH